MLLRQVAWRAFSRAWAKTGNKMAARIAMIAITTRSSISVKPRRRQTVLMEPLLLDGLVSGGYYFALPTGTSRSCVWAVLISNGVGTLAANLLVSPVSTVYIPGGRKNEPVSEVAGSVLSFMVVPTTLPVMSFTMRRASVTGTILLSTAVRAIRPFVVGRV